MENSNKKDWPDEPGWKIDRHVSVAVILMLLFQVAGVLIWATQLEARVGGMEQQSVNSSTLNEKFARLEERLENMKQDIGSMKRQLDRLTERLLKP